MSIKAVVFDLYGTLLGFKQKSFVKELASYLQVSPRVVAEKLFKNYLNTSFENTSLIVVDLFESIFNNKPAQEVVSGCVSIFEKYLHDVKLKHGVLNLLSFLKAKGYKLGLVSNLASPFKQPVYQFGLDKYFDAMVFSCDCGISKPENDIYQLIADQLDAQPKDCLFVGDSFTNDYEAPINFGMQALLIREQASVDVKSIFSVSDLSWLDFNADFEKLIYLGKKIVFNNQESRVVSIATLSDDESGRYNVVARVVIEEVHSDQKNTVYIKRFAMPGSIQVEKLAYEVYGAAGLSTCRADILNETEALLITSEVTGSAWSEQCARELAYDVGRFAAMAYMFSYADFRPRNALIQKKESGYQMQMIDFEHCFFNIALDLEGLSSVDKAKASTFNSMSASEISARRKRTVLSAKHIKRAVNSFIGSVDADFIAYKSGCLDAFSTVRTHLEKIKSLFNQNMLLDSCPMIGTHAYRRAMATIDIEETIMRINQDIAETNLLFD